MAPLAGTVGLKVGPLIMETLVKHYFARFRGSCPKSKETTNLRQDELLYDQVFNVIKAFLTTAANHTVEELQEFSNTRTPSPPWVRVVRLTVPMSCCDQAAEYLIKALGGEEVTKRVVGGTKWWQVRGVKGVPAEWITAKKDWREAKERYKARQERKGTHKATPSDSTISDDAETYQPEMDEQRCILYLHGGGYYFGSVDQERYSIQRFARKINGRVFAVNYRLSPQYPFPCAIQDAIASYLYLINPPPEAPHCAVQPEHIIVMGDSAGGGLSLALLQAIRDSGLSAPAGGVLISPWCDMTHSFPSIHENTATDVMPYYGVSLHKPSTLWPPPPEQTTKRIHQTLKSKIRKVAWLDSQGRLRRSVKEESKLRLSVEELGLFSQEPHAAPPVSIDPGATIPLPNTAYGESQKLTVQIDSGEVLSMDSQLHMYAQNSLLAHPLVGPVGAYLGGLPPLFFIASDGEVLRDEVIYTAHKAAYPDKYPIKDGVKKLCPTLEGIEAKYGPTKVHLQVYDDCAHILPVLFAFTTPAKFCFRAIAGFCRYTTGMLKAPDTPLESILGGTLTQTPEEDINISGKGGSSISIGRIQTSKKLVENDAEPTKTTQATKNSAWNLHGKTSWSRFSRSPPKLRPGERETTDVGGPRFDGIKPIAQGAPCAGDDPYMYTDAFEKGVMIRERVSTRGVIRSLEPEHELPALQVTPDAVGAIPELSIRRYTDGKDKYDRKFARVIKHIEKQRQRHFELAKKEGVKNLSQLQEYLMKEEDADKTSSDEEEEKQALSGSWNWAWALDEDERPPPSSIASRRDTSEARRLAKIADLMPESTISGNNLWSHLVTFLTITPDKSGITWKHDGENEDGKEEGPSANGGGNIAATQAHGGTWHLSKSALWRERFKPKPTSKFQRPKGVGVPNSLFAVEPLPETSSPDSMTSQD